MHSLYFDGASRSNPGPASYGGVIYDENKVIGGGWITRDIV